jgi:hypothetical protein
MRLQGIVLTLVVSSAVLLNKTQSPQEEPVRVAIQEHFTKVSGVTLNFPANWSIDHYEHDGATSYLFLRSGNDYVALYETSLVPGEELHKVFEVSLMGVRAGGGATPVGEQTTTTVDGCEVLVQRLSKKSKQGNQLSVYRGFFSRGFYVEILNVGPENTLVAREAIIKTLHIHP